MCVSVAGGHPLYCPMKAKKGVEVIFQNTAALANKSLLFSLLEVGTFSGDLVRTPV